MSIQLQLQNKIINGGLDYWQRATSFTSIANNAYHADRFHYIKTGAVVHNIARSTDVPSSSTSLYSLQASVTTADSSIVAGDYSGILQHIEGNVLRSFEGKNMVMTFWVKATKTGTYCVALRNGTSTLAYVMEYTVNASNTWEKKTLRFTHSMAGTWAYDTAIGMTVVWTLSSGSTFQTSANSWNTGNFIATANQVNGTDSTSNNFWLSDICLVEDNDGKTRNPDFMYAGRDVFEELQLCQRYYETFQTIDMRGYAVTSDAVIMPLGFKATKRIAPIATANTSFPANSSSASIVNITTTGCSLRTTATTSGGTSVSFTPTFDAEL
jgi:hypothetical protein